jgi:hypothetical protein
LTTIALLVTVCFCQQEILGISSFNFCENISPDASKNGSGTIPPYLNCLDNEGETLQITTIDLRLVASGATNTSFDIDLTTVPTENANRNNKDGTRCSANGAGFENCVVTTPAKIRIESTKYIYYYRLQVVSDIAPQYCYVSRFDTITSDNMHVKTPDGGDYIHTYETDVCMQTVDVKNCMSGSSTTLCHDTESTFGNIVEIATNTFTHPETKINYKFFNNDVDCSTTKKCANCGGVTCNSENSRGTCRNTIFSFDSIRKAGNTPGFSSGFQSVCTIGGVNLTHDDLAVVSSFPISDPPPSNLESSVNAAYGNVLQDITCSGYNCGGIYNAYCQKGFADESDLLSITSTNPICLHNAVKGATDGKGEGGQQIGPIGMNLEIYSLSPRCLLYEIDEVPGVLVTVRFKVTTDTNGDGIVNEEDEESDVDSNGVSSVQEFKLTNVLGLEKISSTQGVAGARVVSVDTLDGYIGPAIPGYIVMCGDPDTRMQRSAKDEIYTDPRKKAAEPPPVDDEESDNGVNVLGSYFQQLDPDGDGLLNSGFIDMRHYVLPDEFTTDISLYDPTVNPWPIIADGLGKTVMYPRGENLNYAPAELNRTDRNAMWYYIPIEKESWIGKGCNQLGLTDLFWNTNFEGGAPNTNTGMEQCYLSPFTCVPGFTENSFGGRSIPGCLASAAFVAAEMGNETRQWQENKDQINYVIENSMPPGYYKEAPNFWTLSLTNGMALAYDPSIDPSGSIPALSFEILIDLVGSFVGYESEVPNGVILTPIICNGSIDEVNTGYITVQNRGLIAGSYEITIQCKSGLLIIQDAPLLYNDLQPGDNLTKAFKFTATTETQDASDPCIVRLTPSGGDVFVIFDEKSFNCVIDIPIIDPADPVEEEAPSNFQNDTCDCMDIPCWEGTEGKSKWDSVCYNLLIWPPVFLFIMFLAATLYFYAIQIKANKYARDSDKDIQKSYTNAIGGGNGEQGKIVENKKTN